MTTDHEPASKKYTRTINVTAGVRIGIIATICILKRYRNKSEGQLLFLVMARKLLQQYYLHRIKVDEVGKNNAVYMFWASRSN